MNRSFLVQPSPEAVIIDRATESAGGALEGREDGDLALLHALAGLGDDVFDVLWLEDGDERFG